MILLPAWRFLAAYLLFPKLLRPPLASLAPQTSGTGIIFGENLRLGICCIIVAFATQPTYNINMARSHVFLYACNFHFRRYLSAQRALRRMPTVEAPCARCARVTQVCCLFHESDGCQPKFQKSDGNQSLLLFTSLL